MLVRYGCQKSNRKTANQLISPAEREQLVNNVNVCQFGQVEELNELQTKAANSTNHTLCCPTWYAIKSVAALACSCCHFVFLIIVERLALRTWVNG